MPWSCWVSVQVFRLSSAVLDDNRTLLIDAATPSHEGRFTCEAENAVGKAARTFVLLFSGPPVFASTGTEPMKVLRGEPALLDCQPAEGNPPFQARWLRDEKPLDEAHLPDGLVLDNTRLMVNSAQPEHAALFSCLVSNSAGQARKDFQVQVLREFLRQLIIFGMGICKPNAVY